MHAATVPNLDTNTNALRIFLVSNALAAGVVPTMIARYGGKPTYVTLYFLAAIGAIIQFCGTKYIGFDNPMGAFGLLVAGWTPNYQTDCTSKATSARPMHTSFKMLGESHVGTLVSLSLTLPPHRRRSAGDIKRLHKQRPLHCDALRKAR
jgi:hypothetical protein